MAQELTKEQQEFLQSIMKHRKEMVEELGYKVLAVALKENIMVFDLPHYVVQRAREIINEALGKVNFENKELIAARKEFLKKCLKEVKKNISVKEPEKEPTETGKRNNRCESVSQALVSFLLDENLIFSDDGYFEKVLSNEEAVPLAAAITGYGDALDEKLMIVISEHWRRAQQKLFGVEKENVTFEMMDEVLKRK